MNILRFNAADLEANRYGKFSDAQHRERDKEATRRRKEIRSTLSFFGVLTFVLYLFAFVLYIQLDFAREFRPSHIPATVTFGLMPILLLLALWLWHRWSLSHYLNAELCIAEGIAEIIIQDVDVHVYGGAGLLHYRFPVPSEKISLKRYQVKIWRLSSPSIFDFSDRKSTRYFENGKHYRVYYLSQLTPLVLSAEEIEPEKAKR